MAKKTSAKKVTITKNGPYEVSGRLPLGKDIILIGRENEPEKWGKGGKYPLKEGYDLCRCGNSKNKPFCDSSHINSHFSGKETASRKPYSKQAQKIKGEGLALCDAPSLCSAARFCHMQGGVWSLTERSGNPGARKAAIREACNCPSGRLVAIDKSGKAIEPRLKKSIGLIEDPQRKCSGPIWLKGGIVLVSADGKEYEVRNRATLCRCGKSGNKPFCDGTHISIGFNDGDRSLRRAKKRKRK